MIRRAAIRSSALGLGVAITLCLAAALAVADPALRVHPHSGPAGTKVHVHGSGFGPQNVCHAVVVQFIDSAGLTKEMGVAQLQDDGTFGLRAQIPTDAAVGRGNVVARKLYPQAHVASL